ncbi:MAG: prepilin-type N-terminal cleavage/methylation domain-containing protein [Candidatus Eremiobacterota bacterium]
MRQRGVTLVEVVFSVVLLGILLAVLAFLFQFGLRSHAKGELSRKAQALCRDAVDRISAELRTALVVPSLQQPSGIVPTSAVLWPGPYDDANPAWGDAFYDRVPRAAIPPSTVDSSVTRNRLIFTRSASAVDSTTIDLSNQFVYVEYVVPVPPQNNRLLRRVYRLASGPGAQPEGQVFLNPGSLNQERWRANPAYFFPNGPGLLPVTGTAEQQSVVILSGALDSMEFEVVQPRHRDYQGLPDAFFEPNLFLVTVRVQLRYQDHVSRAEMSSQVNLQARE